MTFSIAGSDEVSGPYIVILILHSERNIKNYLA